MVNNRQEQQQVCPQCDEFDLMIEQFFAAQAAELTVKSVDISELGHGRTRVTWTFSDLSQAVSISNRYTGSKVWDLSPTPRQESAIERHRYQDDDDDWALAYADGDLELGMGLVGDW